MDANGLRVADEFRMRSPVVWFCFVVVVLCVLSAESSVRRSFHIIHGQGGPIIRSVIPVTGHRSAQPKIQGRRVQRQEEDYDEDEEQDEEEEDEEGFEGEYDGLEETGGGPGPDVVSGPSGYYEEEDEEEEEEDEGEEDYGDERSFNEVQGRQAFINNQYVDTPYNPRQNNRVRQQSPNTNNNNNNRAPVKNNNNRRPNQGNGPNRVGSNANRPVTPNRRRPTASPNPDRQNASPNRRQAAQKTTPTPSQVTQQQPVANKQKLQLRPVASSTQFIATPVADLILRLSISLAKPVGHGNTTFNVPIRVHPAPGFSNVVQLEAGNKGEVESAKADPVDSVAVNLVQKHEDLSEEGDDDEEEDKDQGSAEPVTDLPRK